MKKALITTLGIILSVFCVGTILLSPAKAEETDQPKPAVWPQVSPVSKRLYLVAGTVYDDEFTVENIGSEEFTFKVYASPYNVVGENYDLNFTEETKFTQIARWIKFEQSEYTLPVGEKTTVKFTVDVPADPPAGGQYATIFTETSGKKAEVVESSGIQTISRIGLVIYANLGGETKESSELKEYTLPTFYLTGNINSTSKVANSGNTDFEARFRMEVRPLIGDIAFEKEEVHAILPETERRVEMVWDKTPLLGLFKVNYSVTAPNINRNETHLVLVIPLFIIIITLLLLTFIAIWIILTVRRRKGLQKRVRIS